MRVNSRLLEEFNKIVESKTTLDTFWGKTYYEHISDGKLVRGKFTPADLFEQAMRKYILENK